MRPVIALILMMALTFLIRANSVPRAAAFQQDGRSQPGAAPADDPLVPHGKYLVYRVAMCIQCHSPRSPDGTLDLNRLLTGGVIPIQSPFPKQQWAFRAPPLAGLPSGWTESQVATFLQSGQTPMGHALRPPMPPFRMTESDARSVAAYLRSLRNE
jgi:cytochrome c553